jgi:hypothetical protein
MEDIWGMGAAALAGASAVITSLEGDTLAIAASSSDATIAGSSSAATMAGVAIGAASGFMALGIAATMRGAIAETAHAKLRIKGGEAL